MKLRFFLLIDLLYGILLPVLFLLSLLFSYHVAVAFLGTNQKRPQASHHEKSRPVQRASIYHQNDRYDVLAVFDAEHPLKRSVLIRRASSGETSSFRLGERIFGKGPFISAIETNRVYFWTDGKSRLISLPPQS